MVGSWVSTGSLPEIREEKVVIMPAQCCKDRWERLLKDDPDMPVFTLLGKDMIAVETVRFWLKRAMELGVNAGKLARVREHLYALEQFAEQQTHRMQVPD